MCASVLIGRDNYFLFSLYYDTQTHRAIIRVAKTKQITTVTNCRTYPWMFSFLARAADCSRLRLAAACGIIKIAQEAHCIEYITLEIFQQLSLVMQVIDYE